MLVIRREIVRGGLVEFGLGVGVNQRLSRTIPNAFVSKDSATAVNLSLTARRNHLRLGHTAEAATLL
jgi:hypothetical protein